MQGTKGNQPASRISRVMGPRSEKQKASTQGSSLEDAPDLKPRSIEPAVRARDPSPSKLPVGSLKRPSGLRPPSAGKGKTDAPTTMHRRKLSATKNNATKLGTSSIQGAQSTGPILARTLSGPKEDAAPSKPSMARKVSPTSGQEAPVASDLPRGESESRPAMTNRNSLYLTGAKNLPYEPIKSLVKPRKTSFGSSQTSKGGTKSVAALTATFQQDDLPKSLVESSLELLQLHAIHSKSAQAQREWKESARKFYEAQFNEVVAFKAALNAREKELLLQRNASAIIEWGSCPGDTLERRLQVLSTTLDEAWQLSGPDGRYTLIVQAFEDWYATVESSQKRQEAAVVEEDLSNLVVEGLGDGWKIEVESLQVSLLEAANAVLSLGDLEGESDLARTIALLLELIKNMLDELELIESIEQSLVAQQQSWVQTSLQNLRRDV